MNYNSIEEILSAGTSNMTIVRNNTKQDDGTDTITGVSWFTFNGTTASNIYANGNSWIGFGSDSEHLKVNRRDGALYFLYREEGTLYNEYRFLKIRWDGYSRYNQSSSSYAVTYDVILWETGDISLHMINIPTSYNDGAYSLVASSTYSYSVSISSPDVTFIKTDSGFTVSNSLIQIQRPYKKRYLIRSNSSYYTVDDNGLDEITVDDLTSEVFLDYGVDKVPNINLLLSLENPELLFWRENVEYPEEGLVLTGTPTLPATVYYGNYTITDVSSLEHIAVSSSDDVLFAITSNNGQTWMYYNDGDWVTASSENEGMTRNTLQDISAAVWAEVIASSTIKFRCILNNVDSYVRGIYIKYN